MSKYLLVLSFFIVSCDQIEPKSSLAASKPLSVESDKKPVVIVQATNDPAEVTLTEFVSEYKELGILDIKFNLSHLKSRGIKYFCHDNKNCSADISFVNDFGDKKTAFENYKLVEAMIEDLDLKLKDITDYEKLKTRKDIESIVKLELLKESLKAKAAELKEIIDS